MAVLTVSIVVPTYQRPDYLERCIRSLYAQTLLADEIMVVSRDTDEPTNAKIRELARELDDRCKLLNHQVSRPGFLPPIETGIKQATGDIVVFIDDDAEAFPDWLERIVTHYGSGDVGGVGGRCINYSDFKEVEYDKASKVGCLSWFGRMVGNMYRETTFVEPVAVDFLMGGNMSFRRSLLKQIAVDPVLNDNVAFHWELDLCQQVKKLGFRILFDPSIKVKHHSAPRAEAGLRTTNFNGGYYSNVNFAYLMMKHLSPFGKIAYLFYSFAIGSDRSSGLIHLVVQLLRGRRIYWHDDIYASIRGRLSGIWRYRRLRQDMTIHRF